MNEKQKLTAKQEKFCQEYIKDLNGTQAAIRAGYSKHTANLIACENLTKPNIQAHLKSLMDKVADRNNVTIDSLIKDLLAIKDCSMNDDDRNSALKAIDMLARHLGFYEKDNKRDIQVSGQPVIMFGDTSKSKDSKDA